MSHFSPGRETSVILYLALHFSEVWKNEIVWQSQDIFALFPQSRIPWHSFLSYTPMYEMRIKRSGTVSWFYFCNSFYITYRFMWHRSLRADLLFAVKIKYARKLNRGHFSWFMFHICIIFSEEEKLRNSGYMAGSNNDQSWSILIRKKDWVEIGFRNFKFLSTADIETIVISSIQYKNSSYGKTKKRYRNKTKCS